MTNKLSLQQQRYLRAIEDKYLLPRWSDLPTLIADLYEREARMGRPDNDVVHGFVKMMFNRGRSTNDLILAPSEWLLRLRAYWQERGVDIPEPNGEEAAELIKLYETKGTK